MNENKYYTPDLEDLCVGYEGEINMSLNQDPAWYDYFIKNPYEIGEVSTHINRSLIRTPYLTMEQIYAEDFSVWDNDGTGIIRFSCGDEKSIGSVLGRYEPKSKKLTLTIVDEAYLLGDSSINFDGKCRCINDFRKILKMLQLL